MATVIKPENHGDYDSNWMKREKVRQSKSAAETLRKAKEQEQEKLDSGKFKSVTTFDALGKMSMKLVKK